MSLADPLGNWRRNGFILKDEDMVMLVSDPRTPQEMGQPCFVLETYGAGMALSTVSFKGLTAGQLRAAGWFQAGEAERAQVRIANALEALTGRVTVDGIPAPVTTDDIAEAFRSPRKPDAGA